MKRSKILPCMLAALIGLAACKHGITNGPLVFASSARNGVVTRTITTSNDSVSVHIEYTGDVRFNDDETAIASLSPNGRLSYKKNKDEAVAVSDAKGAITYTLKSNGTTLDPNSAEGKAFLAASIRAMHGYGLDLDRRIEALYRRGGSAAVLNEATQLKADELRRSCIEYVMSRDTQSAALPAMIHAIGTTMQDDFAKKDLLLKYNDRFVKDSAALPAYLDATEAVRTVQARAQLLAAILRAPLAPTAFERAVRDAGALTTESEKAGVLRIAIGQPGAATGFGPLLSAIGTVRADHERATLLNALADAGNWSEGEWIALVNAAAQVGATAEKTELLVHLAQKAPSTEAVRAAYTKAAGSVGGSEHTRIMSAIK